VSAEDAMNAVFSHLCGRGRVFVLDGAALPVCQRCLGLYAGAALTAAWLAVTGLRRRGLPHLEGVLVQSAALLAAMVGGLHWIDLGPAWRLACGLWTGHVALAWLVGGANHLGHLARGLPDAAWPRGKRVQVVLAPAVLAAGAAVFARWVTTGWTVTAALVVVGAAVLALAIARAVIYVGVYLASVLRRRACRGA